MSAKANRIALAALKAKLGAAPEPVNKWALVMVNVVAFHLGGWTPKTKHSMAEHYAKAAEWPSTAAMARALQSDHAAFNERHQAALRRMFAARGVDLDSAGDDAKSLAMYQLIDEAERAGCALESG
jgi:hypothetical protein